VSSLGGRGFGFGFGYGFGYKGVGEAFFPASVLVCCVLLSAPSAWRGFGKLSLRHVSIKEVVISCVRVRSNQGVFIRFGNNKTSFLGDCNFAVT
jgi:hypothetical protein